MSTAQSTVLDEWAEYCGSRSSDELIQLGRVVRVDRGAVLIETDQSTSKYRATDLLVGDWVVVSVGVLLHRFNRQTLLARKATGRTSAEHALAANIDYLVVVEPIFPKPSARRVERMLTLARSSGAEPLVVFTKCDLAPDYGDDQRFGAALAGVRSLAVSALTGEGVNELTSIFSEGTTFAFLGPSGAGKSTLVNVLGGRSEQITGLVRGDGGGRHTTTARHLLTLPNGAYVIDSPGIREVGLVANVEGVDEAFPEIVDLSRECRFSDCAHQGEPGCAVLLAVVKGELSADRLANFLRLQREAAGQVERSLDRDRSAQRADTKGRRRAVRVIMEAKGRR